MNPEDLHIETERLLIRPYTIEDAVALKQGIDESLPELLTYMLWAKNEPSELQTKIDLINYWTKEIEEDTNYTLGIFNKKTGEFIGSTGLHKRGNSQTIEIGYWCVTKHTGNGFITECSKALTEFAFKNLDKELVVIACNTENVKSAAIPNRLGYNLEYTNRNTRKDNQGKRIVHQAWYMFKEEWKQ